jgi:hypothetical protein
MAARYFLTVKYINMKQNQTKRLMLNKKTVSALQANEMSLLKGGAAGTTGGAAIAALPITNPRTDSFVACGSCFGDCASNSTACPKY